MARGRSIPAYERLYIDGRDLSAYVLECGERGVERELGTSQTLADLITGVLGGRTTVTLGPVNAVFDNTPTSGFHVLADAAEGTRRYITHVRGVQGAPAIGDDVFCAVMLQQAHMITQTDNMVTASARFAHDATAGLNYAQHWGALLHPMGSETGANTSNTNADGGAASSAGGWLMYHITSITGSGTVTISVDDSATGTTWAALSGATSGAIATASAPIAGIVQLSTTATVRRYLRWQLAFGGSATACMFALAFMRG